ncbi:hypothetical protein A8H39_00710 [Paraburkholderia fungorum]|nr:hypothetical protein A8H39_00710 [Paraburkholderia fungorum]
MALACVVTVAMADQVKYVREVWPQDQAVTLNASCDDIYNGAIGNTVDRQAMICAGGRWQDGKSLPQASLSITYRDHQSKAMVESRGFVNFVGVTSLSGSSTVVVAATVDSLDANGTAHVTFDVNGDRVESMHVDRAVPVGIPTVVGQSNGKDVELVVKPLI